MSLIHSLSQLLQVVHFQSCSRHFRFDLCFFLFVVALTTFVKPYLVITLFFMIIVKSTKKLANLAIFLVLIQGL